MLTHLTALEVHAQEEPSSSYLSSMERVPYRVFSGVHNNLDDFSSGSREVFTTSVDFPDAIWLRVSFEDVKLGRHSKIVITSLLDGASQTLDAESLEQWRNTSAFFNGGAVEVKLLASPGDREVFFNIKEVHKGIELSEEDKRRIDSTNKVSAACTDDRVQVSAITSAPEGRLVGYDGELVPDGTGWIGANGAIITAGHPIDGDNDPQMIEFRVPN